MFNLNSKIAVIGAGPSGITVLKNLTANGFVNITCFEMSDQIGGNWVYRDKTNHSSVFKTTHIISSKKFSEYLDFPMPDDYPDYPSGPQLLKYFNSYVDHFSLKNFIRFNTKVHKAKQVNNKWHIQYGNDNTVEEFDVLIVANGHHWDPRLPKYNGNFNGTIMHSHQFKNNEIFKDKNVLVVGGGNSACDIAVEVSRVAKKTHISMRRGYHFIPKFLMGIPSDEYYAKTVWIPKGIRLFIQKIILRFLQGSYDNYGLQKPDHDILEAHATINSELLYFIKHGKIAPKVDISSFSESSVVFKDSDKLEVVFIQFANLVRNGEKISMLTAYDFSLARIVDSAGVEVILVGDSASNVIAGHETTLPITLDQMIYHGASVVRGITRALIVVDLPFGSYQGNSREALNSAIRIMKESGSHAVKLEGGKEIKDSIKRIIK